jgi:hypothetical protein
MKMATSVFELPAPALSDLETAPTSDTYRDAVTVTPKVDDFELDID